MPTFCRHNRLIANCPICARERGEELRPVVSSSAPRASQQRPETSSTPTPRRSSAGRGSSTGGVRVRRLARGSDDGYHSGLVPGLRSSEDAARLAEDLALAATRLDRLAADPPGLYAEVADGAGDLEERTWLAFLIAYIGPGDGEDPFAGVAAVRTPWASGELPDAAAIEPGPRGAHDASRGPRTLEAYRAWAGRSGSQAAAISGDAAWTPARRFARVFERLALPGLHRDARFDFLATLGALGIYELQAGSLHFGGDNAATLGAKRALGIGDPLLLDRRAADLATACELPLAALDLGLHNWERGTRTLGGLPAGSEPDETRLRAALAALGL